MKLLKKHLLRLFILILPLISFAGKACAANVFDWTGNNSSSWTDLANWLENGAAATAYPGQGGVTTDTVRIGVNTAIPTFTRFPLLATDITIASLTFGNNNAPLNSTTGGEIILTVNSNLVVTDTILQQHSPTGGPYGSGGTAPPSNFGDFTYDIITTILGNGTITCNTFQIGNNTVGGNDYTVNATFIFIGSNASATAPKIVVNGDLILNSSSQNNGTVVTRSCRALISLQSGTLSVYGTVRLKNNNPFYSLMAQYVSLDLFSLDLYGNANSPTLNLYGATPFVSDASPYNYNPIDFYNIDQAGGTGVATVNYAGADQRVYVYNQAIAPDYYVDSLSGVYQNLTFSGSGTKTVDAGILTVANNLTLAPGTETVDFATNAPKVIVGSNPAVANGGNYTTSTGTTLNHGADSLTFTATTFTNNGVTNFGTGPVIFNSSTATTLKTDTPLYFNNVFFTGGGTKNLDSGKFAVIDTGLLTLSNTTQLAANGNLTLNSDSAGSANIASVPSGCSITGNVTVQRYMQAKRAYRLMSSPVFTGNDGTNNIYSVNYLLTNAYLTGTGGTNAGFDKPGNPTLYLYRENLAPLYTTFLNSNFIGIANISVTPYQMNDATYNYANIPVGNGYLFYYRGSRKQASLAALTTPGAPATTDTLNAAGTLNQGSITVHNWYAPDSTYLGYTNASGMPTIIGTNLVGNPYASSIDWDKFSDSDPTAGIYGPNVSSFAYQLILTGQGSGNYNVYQAGTGGIGTIDTVNSNVIVSGQGFFVLALTDSAQLVFNESAKITTQNRGGALMMMRKLAGSQNLRSKPGNTQYLRLQLAKDSINIDNTLVRFKDNAKTVYVPNEDAPYKVGQGLVSLSSISSDNRILAINQLPLTNNQVIRLNVNATSDGNYALNLKSAAGIPKMFDIWLKDAYMKDSLNMRIYHTYNFTIIHSDSASFGAKRFALVMHENPGLACKLTSFAATKVFGKSQVEITWKTVNEQNYTYFTVQRSTDGGKSFEVIGDMMSDGQGKYDIVDKNPVEGNDQYRLQLIAYNGPATYSNVVQVLYSDQSSNLVMGNISVYPNPVSYYLNLSVLSGQAPQGSYNIAIVNSYGLIIKQSTTDQSSWQTPVGDMLPGTYMLKVMSSKDNKLVGQAKFIKL